MKPVVLDAVGIQDEYGLNRRQAYAVLHAIGVRITPRRLVALRSAVESYLGGDDFVGNGAGNGNRPPTDAASRA
jgi:hypothetical protein